MWKKTSLALCLLIFTVNSFADALDGSEHCPFHATFGGVEIQPLANNTSSLVQCLSTNGNTYWSQVMNVSVDATQTQWIKQEYPAAEVCFGLEPEDCAFYGDS
ncbi:MAG: hypothetical protein KIT27_12270 [Legionellales bacterium]|nr:hypothetical protein [Legionellales bacterium]